MKKSPLHLRVVEIGQEISAPYCTKLLVDIGADVLKIESPDAGDPLRSIGSFPENSSDSTKGTLFEYLNAGKRSVALDLSMETDVKALLEIIARADILIENLGRGILEQHGIDFTRLKKANRNIAVVRISDFGQDGPYAGVAATDFTVQAASGWISKHMAPGRDPVQVGGRIPDYVTGVHAASAALSAFRIAHIQDTAVMVDVSKQECLLSTLPQPALQTQVLTELGWGPGEDRVFPVPGVMECKDGLVGINILTARHFEDFCNVLGIPEHIPNRMALQLVGPLLDAFYRDVQPWVSQHTVDEIVEICQSLRIPAAPVSNGRTLPELSQLKSRGFYQGYPGTDFLRPGRPWRINIESEITYCPAPRLPERDSAVEEIWQDTDMPSFAFARAGGNENNSLPFSGLKVLDMGIMWAGPYVGCYLGAFGADVIKLESIQRPDPYRFSGSYMEQGQDWYERSALFQGTNLNKRGLTLNLNHDEGKRIFERLVASSDVLIENFSPRVLGNFGFDPEHLQQINPRLIILRMPGFGLEGPCKDYVSFAMSIEQVSGMAYVTGRPNELPLNPGGFVDPAASMHALVALQHALLHRERTGEAAIIEIAQLEVGACMTAEQVIAYSLTKDLIGRIGNRSATMAPQGVYPCLNNEWIAVSIRDDSDWERFVHALGAPDWAASENLSTMKARQEKHDELDQRISEWSANLEADAAVEILLNAGIPAARVLTSVKMYSDPHLQARQFYQEVSHPRAGLRKYAGWPMRFSDGPSQHHRMGAPTLGEHNREILSEELGLDMKQIEELARNNVIGNVPLGLG